MILSDYLPASELLIPFIITGLALNITPGADMAFAAMSGARGGYRAGIAAVCGIFSGCLVHIVFAVLGLSALIAASPLLFNGLKWLGVCYLVYIAWQLLQKPTDTKQMQISSLSVGYAFKQAAIINVLNPKISIFFLAFLPQFIDAEGAQIWRQILGLGLVFNLNGTLVNALVAVVGASAAVRCQGSSRYTAGIRMCAAIVLLFMALRLAVYQLT